MSLSIRPNLPNSILPYNHRRSAATSSSPPSQDGNGATTQRLQSAMREQFAAKAQDPRAFHDMMAKTFGPGYDSAKAEGLRKLALAGDFSWLPPVKLLDSASLKGAHGAYDAQQGVVYIDAELAAKNPKLAASTYVEEAGAHLDTMLNATDTLGDEGEMFRRLMGGEKLSAQDVAQIKADDDRGTITVDGKQIAVEFWNPIKSIKKAAKAVGGAIKKAVTGVGSAVKSAASHAWNGVKSFGSAIKNAGSTAMDGMLAAGDKLMSGLGKMTVGFVKNLFTGNVGDAFKSLFGGAQDIVIGVPKQLIRTTIDTARDAAKSVTHLLPEVIGSKIRTVFDKSFNFVGGFTDGFLDALGRTVSAFTDPVSGFLGDVEAAVKRAIDGDFKGAAKAFGAAFKNVPGNFKEGFLNVVAGPQPTPTPA